jgi:hypothetical protein
MSKARVKFVRESVSGNRNIAAVRDILEGKLK